MKEPLGSGGLLYTNWRTAIGTTVAGYAVGMLGLSRFVRVGLGLVCVLAAGMVLRPGNRVEASGQTAAPAGPVDPNVACALCHQAIYNRYRMTPMAHASGAAVDGFIPADFVHTASGVHYRITEDAGHVWLSYERDDPARPLKGRQELFYFLGSGNRGRTYLFERDGYWFESPINWYAKKRMWDMAPNFLSATEAPLTLPVDPGCLHCHASGVTASLPDARNHYAGVPFTSAGITCTACHGDPSAHLISGGKIAMIEIDKLPATERDSVCLNCHLEGQAAVVRQGKRLEDFKPGDDLFDYAQFFVYKSPNGSEGRAVSQWEALLKSKCKQKSGDKLTCTTCHDPHGSPAPSERVAYYRAKCLQCHNKGGFAVKHHPENPDCTECHMARPPSNDIAHEQVTDHWIRIRVSEERQPLATTGELVAVGGQPASDRDLGLAYAQMAQRGDPAAGMRAMTLLSKAETQNDAAKDHELHTELGFLEQMNGDPAAAGREYLRALQADPFDSIAGGDLALIEAKEHQYADAIRLLSEVTTHDPSKIEAGMNLAILDCVTGNRSGALQALERVLAFAPDNDRARELGMGIQAGTERCGGK